VFDPLVVPRGLQGARLQLHHDPFASRPLQNLPYTTESWGTQAGLF
jgi:hypothetical protein